MRKIIVALVLLLGVLLPADTVRAGDNRTTISCYQGNGVIVSFTGRGIVYVNVSGAGVIGYNLGPTIRSWIRLAYPVPNGPPGSERTSTVNVFGLQYWQDHYSVACHR